MGNRFPCLMTVVCGLLVIAASACLPKRGGGQGGGSGSAGTAGAGELENVIGGFGGDGQPRAGAGAGGNSEGPGAGAAGRSEAGRDAPLAGHAANQGGASAGRGPEPAAGSGGAAAAGAVGGSDSPPVCTVTSEVATRDTENPSGTGRLFAVTESGALITFEAETPDRIVSTRTLAPLAAGEHVIGIDFRPATGALYALTRNGVTAQLHRLDANTGSLTALGSTFQLVGARAAVNFDPAADSLRIVSDAGINFRLHPETGAVLGVDGSLVYAAGDIHDGEAARVVAAAYASNVSGAPAAALYAIDGDNDSLVRVNAQTGAIETIGPLGVDFTTIAAFDITGAGHGHAYAVLHTEAKPNVSQLFRIDLRTGLARSVGPVSVGERARALAIDSPTIYGVLTDGTLVSFSAQRPGQLRSIFRVMGNNYGIVLALAYRPATSECFALSRESLVYGCVIGGCSAIAPTLVPNLKGTQFAFAVDPTRDELRIVSNTGQNLSLKPYGLAGALLGPDLAPGPVHATAIAHTPVYAGAANSAMYGIDSQLDQLIRFGSPDHGTAEPIGPLGARTSEFVGFTTARDGMAYASLVVAPASTSTLYAVDLTTGHAEALGAIGSPCPLRALASPLGARSESYGISNAKDLTRFVTYAAEQHWSFGPVEGLAADESIAAVTWVNQLAGVTNRARLFRLARESSPLVELISPAPFTQLQGSVIAADYDPMAGVLRVVTNAGENLRVNLETGVLSASDAPLAYTPGDENAGQAPDIVALAYTPLTASGASAYAIDATRNQLVRIGGLHGSPPANTGLLTTIGSLGVDVSNEIGFEIAAGGTALLSTGDALWVVNLADGSARPAGRKFSWAKLRGLASSVW